MESAGAAACEVRFGIRLYHTDGSSGDGSRDYTDVVYQLDTSTSPAPSLGLWVLSNHTGGATSDHGDNQAQGGPVVISAAGIQTDDNSEWRRLSLTVFSDLSIIEAFAQDGQEAITSRIYPLTKLLKASGSLAPWSAGLLVERKPLQPAGCGGEARMNSGQSLLVRGYVEAFELGSAWVDSPDLLPGQP